MAIIDEPVRGSIPPPWWWSLPGLERMQTLARGYILQPPLFRLLGIRVGHVGPGFCTWTMPATAWLAGPGGELDLLLFLEAALTGTALSAVGPGQTVEPLTLNVDHFRPIRPANGNFVARCRVVNASRFFTYTTAEVEDPNGRQLLHASSHAELRRVDPEPPPAPAEVRPVEEPTYATPDPYRRPVDSNLSMAELESGASMAILESIMNGNRKIPYATLLKNTIVRLDAEGLSTTIPASAWCSVFAGNGIHGLVASFGSATGNLRGFTQIGQGRSFVGLSHHTEFLKPVDADGRLLRADISDPKMGVRDIRVYDAEGDLVSVTRGCVRYVDSAQRQRRRATPTKRVLCTLLFTDIVGSTQHAERLGDQEWQALLEEQRRKIRSEIARCNGTEIDTAGDGFFVRFDSPADALDCAVAAVQTVKPLGIEIRAGVHTGECEVTGRDHAGMAVHMGARVMAAADPGEILVSSTVKDLVMGSGRQFADRGEHQLKGVQGSWRLHALV